MGHGSRDAALRGGTPVYGRQGRIGTLQGADYDPASGDLLTLRVTVPGSASPLTVPATLVQDTDDGVLVLSVGLAELGPLDAIPGAGIESPLGVRNGVGRSPADTRRPLWYRASAALEPLRPAFAWAVEYRKPIRTVLGLSSVGACAVLALLALARITQGRRVG
ncbi:MAG: hypothetical protein M3Q29_00855 [Chloroflexota bacterium]|nr:hypothetical protein [Chloroflexota bacterium]